MSPSQLFKCIVSQGLFLILSAMIPDFGQVLTRYVVGTLAWDVYLILAVALKALPRKKLPLVLVPALIFALSMAASEFSKRQ